MTNGSPRRMSAQVDEVVRMLAEDAEHATVEQTANMARRLVHDMPPEVLRYIAVKFLTEEVRHVRRIETLRVEREAARAGLAAIMGESPGVPPARHPAARKGGIPRKGTAARLAWETETEEGREWAAREAEFEAERTTSIIRMVDDFAAALRTEWTRELLASTFSLADGTMVAWGEASAEQHRERLAMFTKNIRANAEGAARHRQAIIDLERTHASCLNEALASAA